MDTSVPQAQSGGTRAPIGSSTGSPPRTSARRRRLPTPPPAEAVAAVATPSAEAKELAGLDITGIKQSVVEGITVAKGNLDLTKGVKALEHVADATTVLARGLKGTVLAHDELLAKVVQRLDVLETRATESDDAIKLVASTSELNRAGIDVKLKSMMEEANAWEAVNKQTVQEKVAELDAKLDESAKMFIKCDEYIACEGNAS